MQNTAREAFARLTSSMRKPMRYFGRLGFGRHAGLAATRRMFPARAHTPALRALSLFVGSSLIGVGVGLLTQARLGLSPYDVLVSGLQPRLGLSFGVTVMVVSAFLFLIAAILGHFPSRWGIAYVVANGVAIDAVSGLIGSPESLFGRYLFVFAALVILSSGISLIVHSGSTGGAFELLMKAGEERGRDRRVVRTSLEVTILVTGIALGGTIGPATLVIALGIGPMLGVISTALQDHSRGRTMRRIDELPESRHPSAMATQPK